MIGKTIFALLFSTLLLAAVQQTQPDPKAILPAAAASTPQTATTIPRGGSVTPDGTLAEAEWADALREKLTGGAELRLKADAEFLYVGLRSGGQGWPQVSVWDGKAVRALHASASLGTATYRKSEGSAWKLEQGFAWELRSAKADDPARRATKVDPLIALRCQ